jgi:cell division protein FtsW
MKFKKPVPTPEKSLFFLTVCLCLLGLLFVFEASVAEAFATFGNPFYFVRQQAVWLVIGVLALFGGMFVPTQFLRKISPFLYGTSILLLLCVFLPGIGKSVNGAARWISLAGINLQPVEVVKFAVITFYATWMEKHQKLSPFLFLTLLPVGLLLLQPDMGSALIVLSIAFGMYFLAGAPWKTFIFIGLLGIAALTVLVMVSPYRVKRLTTFINPEADPLGSSFHIRQITLALGNGGFLGQGVGKSRQKFSYLPEASTDSIFAIVAEEVGFVGSLILFFLFMLYLQAGYQITKKIPAGSYDHLLTSGIMIWIGMQILLNLSAIVALVPLTGIPLPFFSYGGTSLVMVLFVTGILIGVGKRSVQK